MNISTRRHSKASLVQQCEVWDWARRRDLISIAGSHSFPVATLLGRPAATTKGVTMIHRFKCLRALLFLPLAFMLFAPKPALADGDVRNVKHVIVVMQENHSFDNYFGALAYAPNSPYRPATDGCRKDDHDCVDGLTCKTDATGNITCSNSNVEDNGITST
jgi:hypothetical protein